MLRRITEEKKRELNELGEIWCSLKEENDEASKMSVRNKIWIILMECSNTRCNSMSSSTRLDDSNILLVDVVNTFMEKRLKNFKCEKTTLYSYAKNQMHNYVKKEVEYEHTGAQRRRIEYEVEIKNGEGKVTNIEPPWINLGSVDVTSLVKDGSEESSIERGKVAKKAIKKVTKKEERWVNLKCVDVTSLAKDGSEESSIEIMDNLCVNQTTDVSAATIARLELCSKWVQLTTLILNLHVKQSKYYNKVKLKWWKLFYTEDLTYILHKSNIILQHERDIFEALNVGYLDFYMLINCRTLEEIRITKLKNLAQISGGSEQGEIQTPFEAKIMLAYLAKVEGEPPAPGTRSGQHKNYFEELQKGKCFTQPFEQWLKHET